MTPLSLNILVLTSSVFLAIVFLFFLDVVYSHRDPIFTYNIALLGHIKDYPQTTSMQLWGFFVLAFIHYLCWLVVLYTFLWTTFVLNQK